MLIVASVFWALSVYCLTFSNAIFPAAAIAIMGAAFWTYVESICIVLDRDTLVFKRFFFPVWTAARSKARVEYGRSGDYGGFPAVLVLSKSTGKKIGAIPLVQFKAKDIDRIVEWFGA